MLPSLLAATSAGGVMQAGALLWQSALGKAAADYGLVCSCSINCYSC
jgi:hypothetical protein